MKARFAPWLLAAAAWAAQPALAQTPPARIVVGSLTLERCVSALNGYCGKITRPLDPVTRTPGTITVGFEYYPRTNAAQPSQGTILPQEGGPGYASTDTREAFLALFAPLRTTRDILIVDKRGTGRSTPINCPALQASNDKKDVASCARQLGPRAWYHGTAIAVADVVAVLDALGIDRVDYYGDSYGTYFGQVFAARHGNRLRSMVLDSAYPARPSDPWFSTDWPTARDGFDLVCERSPSCRALGHPPTLLIAQALKRLRSKTLGGKAPDGWGVRRSTTLDAPALHYLMFHAGYYPPIYRDLDAAIRAWLEQGDKIPLLRLQAEVTTEWRSSDPADFSAGLYAAITCQEYPLHYGLRMSRARRLADFQAAIADIRARRPGLFAPFTIDEGLASGADITPLDRCIDWSAPPPGYAQGDALPATPVFPAVPTLVLSGDLDSITSVADGARAAAQFPDVVHLVVPNLTHITAFSNLGANVGPGGADYTGCVSQVVLNFVRNLAPGDTSCIGRVRPIRTVPRFATLSSQIAPARPTTGNKAGTADLRLAAAAAETVGDALARFFVSYAEQGAGLRAGRFTYRTTGNGYEFTLSGLQWVKDLAVSGTMSWNVKTGEVSANVKLRKSGTPVGNLTIAWNDRATNAVATLTGKISGKAVRATRIAP